MKALSRREWYQKGYNQAMKQAKELKQKVSEVFEDKSQAIRSLIGNLYIEED